MTTIPEWRKTTIYKAIRPGANDSGIENENAKVMLYFVEEFDAESLYVWKDSLRRIEQERRDYNTVLADRHGSGTSWEIEDWGVWKLVEDRKEEGEVEGVENGGDDKGEEEEIESVED